MSYQAGEQIDWMFGRLTPKPIPSHPTHCRGCPAELPPLRRYAGFCQRCVTTGTPARLHARSKRP